MITLTGRTAEGFVIEPILGDQRLDLPKILECEEIPNNRSEMPTSNIAKAYPHLRDFSSLIPEIDNSVEIPLLSGRDMTQAHHVLSQRIGAPNEPFAQRLILGWKIIGEVCFGKSHIPKTLSVRKTVIHDGRQSLFEPIRQEKLTAKEKSSFHQDIFSTTSFDETRRLSTDDRAFLDIMLQNLGLCSALRAFEQGGIF
jgi:hypothetical protein